MIKIILKYIVLFALNSLIFCCVLDLINLDFISYFDSQDGWQNTFLIEEKDNEDTTIISPAPISKFDKVRR
jgi:hypothetical protein